jgi:hypothetical protein
MKQAYSWAANRDTQQFLVWRPSTEIRGFKYNSLNGPIKPNYHVTYVFVGLKLLHRRC